MEHLKELFEETIENESIGKAFVEAYKITTADKHEITRIQVAHHRKGNKITWDQAKEIFLEPKMKAAKNARNAKRRANYEPKERAPKLKLNQRKFDKIMRDARKDFEADFGGESDYTIADVAWDVAGSLMYDKDIDAFVRHLISRNTGIAPERINKNIVQEYIADSIAG